ncbi:MAG: winged helix-turn-helix domain-containing protein [Nitrososphaerales archaeon]|jgi:predicted transcriptional regulator
MIEKQHVSLNKIRRISRTFNVVLVFFLIFAISMSSIALIQDVTPSPSHTGPPVVGPPPKKTPQTVPVLILGTISSNSLPLSLGSWVCVGGFLVWRGRIRSTWANLGFDQDVFKLFVRMKGASTRLRLLQSLSHPKDRAQLSDELGIDWKAVDRHVQILAKYGFVKEKETQGTARFYELTPSGNVLLKLIEEAQHEQ